MQTVSIELPICAAPAPQRAPMRSPIRPERGIVLQKAIELFNDSLGDAQKTLWQKTSAMICFDARSFR